MFHRIVGRLLYFLEPVGARIGLTKLERNGLQRAHIFFEVILYLSGCSVTVNKLFGQPFDLRLERLVVPGLIGDPIFPFYFSWLGQAVLQSKKVSSSILVMKSIDERSMT